MRGGAAPRSLPSPYPAAPGGQRPMVEKAAPVVAAEVLNRASGGRMVALLAPKPDTDTVWEAMGVFR